MLTAAKHGWQAKEGLCVLPALALAVAVTDTDVTTCCGNCFAVRSRRRGAMGPEMCKAPSPGSA